jgi:hypothetical protein
MPPEPDRAAKLPQKNTTAEVCDARLHDTVGQATKVAIETLRLNSSLS